jgi:hypothetical protein
MPKLEEGATEPDGQNLKVQKSLVGYLQPRSIKTSELPRGENGMIVPEQPEPNPWADAFD